jgi:hypothetical protein
VVIYVNRSYSWSIKSVTSLINIVIGGFSGVIKYKKERLANIVIISNT